MSVQQRYTATGSAAFVTAPDDVPERLLMSPCFVSPVCEDPELPVPEVTESHDMSDERPAGVDMYRYYRRLLKDHWLGTAICWTVVVPDNGEPLTLAEIGERVSGGANHEIHEKARFEDDYSDEAAWAMLVGQSGPMTELFEDNGYHGVHPPTLSRLSVGARAYSVYWNVNANNSVAFAADGELLLMVDAMYPEAWAQEPNLARWPELAVMAPHFKWRNGKSWRAAALATIELTTGARLSLDWFDQERPYLTSQDPASD
ncbi:DUF6461 domain-containing protein [Streptosporangium sp. NPDC006930]|uniref:DUF6461 domain-containing protein n=1 Tax=Streptosporangium sp. NPDC006930 TaxID=3154783 RepID=UPI00341F9056